MAINMTAIINQELAKIEKRESAYGESVDPAMDAFKEVWEMGQEQKVWNERKNAQRQSIMSELSRGTSMTFNEKDLERKKERFQNYYNKHRGSMDENTLEMGQFMLEDFGVQADKNTEFNKLLGDGEQLKKDLLYDMENVGVDEEGNQRTLDENDYQIISEQQKRWINHTKEMQTNFADRLSLKPFQHINSELANATNMNQFLLAQAREDNLIDDRELQAYQDAWTTGSYDPVTKYLGDEKAGRDAAINFNINQLGTGAQRYQELQNLFENKGVIKYQDVQGNKINVSLETLQSAPDDQTATFYEGLIDEYASLEGQLTNLNRTNTNMTGSDFLANTGITFEKDESDPYTEPKYSEGLDKVSRKEAAGVIAGTKDITDITKVKETKEDTTLGMSGDDWDKATDAAKIFGGTAVVLQSDKIINATKFIAKNTSKSLRYIKSATNLSNAQVEEFLKSKSVKNTSKHLDKLTEKLKTKDLLKRDPALYKEIQDKINSIKNNQTKYWAKKFGKSEADIGRLFKTGNRDKWNVFKMKKNIATKFPKFAGKLGSKYAIGSMITDAGEWALRTEIEGVPGAALDIGVGHYAEKQITKKFLPQLTKMITSESGKKYLAKVVGKKAAQKIGTTALAGSGVPLWGNIAMGLIGSGLASWDIYQLVKNWNEEEE